MAQKEELAAALRAYHDGVASGDEGEAELDALLEQAIGIVPNARLSDMIFWNERQRSDAEFVDEALVRERLWQDGGDLAVALHVQDLYQTALDAAVAERERGIIEDMLESVTGEIDTLRARRH